jgi:hypothetical protein
MLQRRVRAILALLVLCGFISVTVAAVSPGHMHGPQKPHSCGLCQFNLTPFVAANRGPVIWPPQSTSHGIVATRDLPYSGPNIFSGACRAPPIA